MTSVNLVFPRYLVPILQEFYPDIDEKHNPFLTYVSFGIIGSILISIILTLNRRLFKLVTLLLNILVILSFVALQYSLEHKDEILHPYYFIYLNGFATFPLTFIFFEWSIVITPKISESLSSGNINMNTCFISLFAFAALFFDFDFIEYFGSKYSE